MMVVRKLRSEEEIRKRIVELLAEQERVRNWKSGEIIRSILEVQIIELKWVLKELEITGMIKEEDEFKIE